MIWPFNLIQQRIRRRAMLDLVREARRRHVHTKPFYQLGDYGVMAVGLWKFVLKRRAGFDNTWDVVERFATVTAAVRHMQSLRDTPR